MDAYFSVDGARAGLVLILALGQAVMAYWPDLRRWPQTIATRSAGLRNPVVPIDWSFAIWGLIFLSSLAFGVWQLLPAQLGDPVLRQIGWLACGLYAANVLWELYVPKRALDGVSVTIILVELTLVLGILSTIAASTATLSTAGWWLVHAPFQLFAGWVSAATFVNAASALQNGGVKVGTRLSAAMISAAAALGATVVYLSGAWIYALTVAWALFGLVIANAIRAPNRGIAALSGALIPAVMAPLAFQ